MTNLTDTVTLLLNTPIVPSRRKNNTTDIPLMELSGPNQVDRRLRDRFGATKDIALHDFSSDSTRTSIQSRGSSTASTQPSD